MVKVPVAAKGPSVVLYRGRALRHTRPGVARRFLDHLSVAMAHVREDPAEKGGMAPVYGMAASVPVRGMVSELLVKYVDRLYEA